MECVMNSAFIHNLSNGKVALQIVSCRRLCVFTCYLFIYLFCSLAFYFVRFADRFEK